LPAAVVERFAKEFLAVYGASGYRPVAGAPPDTGARPWSRRLRLTSLKAIRQNQGLGVRYASLFGLLAAAPDLVLPTPEAVMCEIVERGAVLARLPPPSSVVAVCMGFDPARLAWLVPVAPLATLSRFRA
jgi:hypothetical protein